MLTRALEWSLRHRVVVVSAWIVIAVAGVLSAIRLPIDAFPDTTPIQVQINVGAPALGPLEIDEASHTVRRDGEEIPLSHTEFRLLAELARRPGQVFTRELLLEQIWGYDYLGDSRLVDVAIQRLRAKVEAEPAHPELILTVRGVGYKARR